MTVARRANIAIAAAMGLFGLLAFRLAHIQVLAADEYRGVGVRQRTSVLSLPQPRGEIRDVNGTPLAYSERGFELWAEPERIAEPETVAGAVAEALGEEVSEVLPRFWQARRRVVVARGLSIEQAQAVRDVAARGLALEEGCRRVYPLGSALVHSLGVVGRDGNGIEGLEYAWDKVLAGRAGHRELLSDALHRGIDLGDGLELPGVPGTNLVLTIDSALERIVAEEMEREGRRLASCGGSAVALDPVTGDVRAIVSWPSYRPEDRGDVRGDAARNRPVADAVEPGSTFKSFVVAWAVDRGVVRPGESIDCENGAWRAIGDRIVRDTHPLGIATIEDILVYSSNIGAAKIGRRLGEDRLYDCVTSFGFGKRTGIGLPGEASGIVGPRTAWSAHTVISVPFGHELAVTPLQLATGYAALVNGGLLVRPRLIDRLEDADGSVLRAYPRQPAERVISESTSAWVRSVLHRVVEQGTGRGARVEGLAVGGKTGTAQKYDRDPETGRVRPSPTRTVASFVGFAPVDEPRLVVAVVWDEPVGSRYGGSAAAPVVGRILKRAFGEASVKGVP